MQASVVQWWYGVRKALAPCTVLLCLVFSSIIFLVSLSGCATTGASVGMGADLDTLTPSEESEARRRARIRLELASNYFESGQAVIALDEIKQALTIDPSYTDAYNLLGLIYMRLNEYPQAQDNFRKALGLRPLDANILHNYAWLLCLQKKYLEADQEFLQVLENYTYTARSKTLMAQGLCQARAGNDAIAERTLLRSYELDAGNPVVAYNLAVLLFRRGDFIKSQFYIRRLNNSEMSNAETLWLGIKVERSLESAIAMRQLAEQLRKRFPDSREQSLYEKGSFDE